MNENIMDNDTNDTEFLKEWDLLASAGNNEEKGDDVENGSDEEKRDDEEKEGGDDKQGEEKRDDEEKEGGDEKQGEEEKRDDGDMEDDVEKIDDVAKEEDVEKDVEKEAEVKGDDEIRKNDEDKNNDSSTKETEVTDNETIIQGSSVEDIIDLEAAVNESSSSDIDVIDEVVEECTTSCVLPSSSLSITPTVDKALSTSSENSSIFTTCASENSGHADTKEPEETFSNQNSKNERPEKRWTICGRPVYDWIYLLLDLLRNLSGVEWGVVFGLAAMLYINITVYQTNTIGLEKDEVLTQMKKIVDEFKHDNKLLKNQMLSEIQNDKVISSFEHQIRELKKENSRLNHMLRDVVSVLQKQKDSQEKFLEKKENEYQAPLKKEINKLKEHINILKFDNEELQKQLVRMRYASYSQGGKHSDVKDKSYEKKREKEAHETKEPISDKPLDVEQLKKWNELITLLANELKIADEKPGDGKDSSVEKGSSKTEFKYDWSWKLLKENFKDNLLPKVNISDFISKYMNYNAQTVSDLYDTVNSYFTSAQENAQEVLKSFMKRDEETEMLKFLKSLKEYWARVKNKYFKSFVKKPFQPTDEDLKTFESHETPHPEYDHQSSKYSRKSDVNPEFDYPSSKPEEHDKTSNVYFESDNKIHKAQADVNDDSKWVFKRAEYRAQRREEDESSINWFLRRGKELFGGKPVIDENNEDVFAEE